MDDFRGIRITKVDVGICSRPNGKRLGGAQVELNNAITLEGIDIVECDYSKWEKAAVAFPRSRIISHYLNPDGYYYTFSHDLRGIIVKAVLEKYVEVKKAEDSRRSRTSIKQPGQV